MIEAQARGRYSQLQTKSITNITRTPASSGRCSERRLAQPPAITLGTHFLRGTLNLRRERSNASGHRWAVPDGKTWPKTLPTSMGGFVMPPTALRPLGNGP